MRPLVPALLLLAPALFAAEEVPSPPRKKLSAISLLPDGSELMGVMLPRYDENHRLAGVLKADAVTLVNDEMIAGRNVAISFSNPDGSTRGHIRMTKALVNQVKGILKATEPITLQTDKLSATGTGLYYAFEQGEGFLAGPATTWLHAPIETTMNSRPSPLRATALAGLSLITQAIAVTPPPIDQDALKAAATPAAPIHEDAARVARMDLRADIDASAAATAKAKAFLEQAELVAATSSGNPAPPPEAKPLEVKPGPQDTVISCDGGMYFDADEGVFVYLKNVRVNDPRFSLSGANELKIFLAKKPDTGKPKTGGENQPGIGLGDKFGDVERIVATGEVRILQKKVEAGNDPVEASGAIFSYRPESGIIILSGGYPWVKKGSHISRAMEPNLTLRIEKSGNTVTDGHWETVVSLEPKR